MPQSVTILLVPVLTSFNLNRAKLRFCISFFFCHPLMPSPRPPKMASSAFLYRFALVPSPQAVSHPHEFKSFEFRNVLALRCDSWRIMSCPQLPQFEEMMRTLSSNFLCVSVSTKWFPRFIICWPASHVLSNIFFLCESEWNWAKFRTLTASRSH